MKKQYSSESGNVLLFILIAVVLIGILTVAMRGSGDSDQKIDDEKMSLKVSQTMSYVRNVEAGIKTLLNDKGLSETEMLFAHDLAHADYGTIVALNQAQQLFDYDGANVVYQTPVDGINDGTNWEFMGQTHAPGVGSSDRSDLLLVLPNVTQAFCEKVNEYVGYGAGVIPTDSSECVYVTTARYDTGDQFDDVSPNTMDEGTFVTPAHKACVQCVATGDYHFYSVVLDR